MSELRRFDDHVVVVVGGGGGIGRAIALRFAMEGAHVLVADQDVSSAEKVVSDIGAGGGSAEPWLVNAADPLSVKDFFSVIAKSRSSIDVLVNCPAHTHDTPFDRVTDTELDEDVRVTLKAPFWCIQAALPLLLRSDHGPSVVSVGSVNGIEAFGNEAYSAAKAGLINLTKNLAVRYGAQGLRLNVVAPGTVRTQSWDARLAAEPDVLDRIARFYPLRRVGRPEDIAGACLFLASPDASWITGQTLPVDGGITAGHSELIGAIFGDDFFGSAFEEAPTT